MNTKTRDPMAVAPATDLNRMTALEGAMINRRERGELLRRLKANDRLCADVIRDPPDCVHSMFVFDFLRLIPRVGATKIREINQAAISDRVNLAVTLRDLTPRRRDWLVNVLATSPRTGRVPIASRPQG